MIRYRFKCNADDPRPMTWPLKHPYWVTGYGGGYDHDDLSYATVVAYGDDLDYIMKNWPDACDITEDEATDYLFTERFPKPTWFEHQGNM